MAWCSESRAENLMKRNNARGRKAPFGLWHVALKVGSDAVPDFAVRTDAGQSRWESRVETARHVWEALRGPHGSDQELRSHTLSVGVQRSQHRDAKVTFQ